jgi:outer membrane protein
MDFAQKSDAIPSLEVPADAIRVDKQTIPDIDFEYFFTKGFSTELVLTYPQSQTVTVQQSALGGPVDIGTFKYLPPTLTANFGKVSTVNLDPWLFGVGIGYRFWPAAGAADQRH